MAKNLVEGLINTFLFSMQDSVLLLKSFTVSLQKSSIFWQAQPNGHLMSFLFMTPN